MVFEALVLRDDSTGSTVRIVPGLGFNCYSFEAILDGQPRDILWSHPDLLLGTQKPSRSGIPILFPFAGRIRGTRYQFEGQNYSLPAGDDFGNAIHGFVLNRPWRVLENRGSRACGQFQASEDAPEVLKFWPADFRITVTYALRENQLTMETRIENPGETRLPFWFGTHPYFRVPLSENGKRDACKVYVPASNQWELKDLLPTGRILSVQPHCDLRTGRQFGDLKVDDILTGLQTKNGQYQAKIVDDTHTLQLTFGQEYSECVVFIPPHREAVCIEPYTSVSNAFELIAEGVKTGMRVLASGQSFQTSLTIQVS